MSGDAFLTIDTCGALIMPSVEELPYHGASPLGERRFRLEGGDLAPEWVNRPPRQPSKLAVESSGMCAACDEPAYPYAWDVTAGYVDTCAAHAKQALIDAGLGDGSEVWCEMTVYPDGTLGSYGGSVWPMAWPELFAAIPASAQAGSAGVRLTGLGFKLLGMHVTVTPCEPSPDRRPKWLVRIDGKVAGALREYPAGLYQLDMVHALGFYETPEEATKQAIAYVEDMEKGAAHKEESIG